MSNAINSRARYQYINACYNTESTNFFVVTLI